MQRRILIGGICVLLVFFGGSTGISFAQKETGGKGTTTSKEFSMYEPAQGERINAFMIEKIVGSKVRNMKGEDLGTIEDIVVDIDTGRILYVIMDFGGFLGIGGRLFPVPWHSLAPLPSEGIFFLDVSKTKLKDAPAYDKDSLPDMGNLHWGTKVADFYSASQEEKDYDYSYGYSLSLYPGLAQLDPFAKIFDPQSIKAINGEVVKVEHVVPKTGIVSQMQIKLIVFLNRKNVIPVYLGPVWYIIGPDRRIPFKSGDRITATGSWITGETEPFMIATAVTKGGLTLQLRRKNGTPLWNAWGKVNDLER
jgi:sporulation protein YlmC with PRC-barrel domain